MTFTGLFAEGIDALSGSGWVGIGLLGPVLFWLCYYHLPAKDALLKELIAGKDNLVKDMVAIFNKSAAEMTVSNAESACAMAEANIKAESDRRADFKEMLKAVVDHCTEEMASVRSIVTQNLQTHERPSARQKQPAS